MKWSFERATLEGAMRMLDGQAPFARADAILRWPDRESLLRGRDWAHDGVSGDVLDEHDYERFIDTRQASRWRDICNQPVRAVPHMAVWILRQGFTRLMPHEQAVRELEERQALVAQAAPAGSGVTVVVVREDLADPERERWSAAAFDRAWQMARSGDWQSSAELADIAFVVDRSLAPERVALLSLALEQIGEKTDAEGTLIMAEQSRGPQFRSELHAKLREYRDILCPPSAAQKASDSPESPANGRRRAGGLRPGVYEARHRAIRNQRGFAA